MKIIKRQPQYVLILDLLMLALFLIIVIAKNNENGIKYSFQCKSIPSNCFVLWNEDGKTRHYDKENGTWISSVGVIKREKTIFIPLDRLAVNMLFPKVYPPEKGRFWVAVTGDTFFKIHRLISKICNNPKNLDYLSITIHENGEISGQLRK